MPGRRPSLAIVVLHTITWALGATTLFALDRIDLGPLGTSLHPGSVAHASVTLLLFLGALSLWIANAHRPARALDIAAAILTLLAVTKWLFVDSLVLGAQQRTVFAVMAGVMFVVVFAYRLKRTLLPERTS